MDYCQDIYNFLCKKYPNRNIFVISDHHFYHKNIINFTRKDFNNVEEMHNFIINQHNLAVEKDDIVIFLGDFCFRKEYIKDILKQLNGHKFLILGNHDSEKLLKIYPTLGFEGVYKMPVKIKDNYLSHEPLTDTERNDLHFRIIVDEFKKCANAVNFHGHIHEESGLDENTFKNCTCEVMDFKPYLIGRTIYMSENSKPLFINSKYFGEALVFLKNKYNCNPEILMQDYIYSLMLDVASKYQNEFFVYGSFKILKKYAFISHVSDLDLGFIYNDKISKNKNINLFKEIVDEIFEKLKNIEGINLNFWKRYTSIRILEILYTSNNPYFAKCFLDANLVFGDFYKDTDFLNGSGKCILEKLLNKWEASITDDYLFPNFNVQYFVPEADVASLVLQLLFQNGQQEKRILALRKLQYIYKREFKDDEMVNFMDIFIRLFLRNMVLFCNFNRSKDILFVQSKLQEDYQQFVKLFKNMPDGLQEQIYQVLNNPCSPFLDIANDVANMPLTEIDSGCLNILQRIKK